MFLGTSIVAAEPISRPFLVSWSNVEAKIDGDFWEIHFSTPLNGVLAGRRGAIARTTDAGTSWYKTESGVEADLWSASFPEPADGWIVGDSGTIIVTHDGGATWRKQNSRTNSSLVGVSFSNARQGWAIASDGKVIHTSDGGETWEWRWSETGTTFAAISFADYRTGWIVGGEGKIFRTRDGGVTWQRQESGTSQNLWSVQFNDLNNGWAIGESGTVLVTHDGGIQWLMQSSGTERDLSRIYFVNSTTAWIVGDGGTILTTRDGGEHWRIQQSGTKRLLIGVHFADANSGWIVGFRGLLLKATLIGVSPEVEEISTRSSGVLGELKVVLKLRGESEPTGVYLWARTGRAAWINLGEARPTSGAQWTYSWRPSQVGFHAGDEIEYKVQLEDAGPPAFVIVGRFLFEPWWIRLWRDNKKIVAGVLIATSALLLLFAATTALFVFAPASLAHVGALTQEKEKVEFKFSFGSLLSLGNRLLQEFLLPFLCRRSRVKQAWTAKYLDGRVKFSNLNSPARKIFFGDAGILDAWVVRVAEQVEVGLKEIEFFQQRGVYVEFPLNDSRGDCAIERPSPEAFRPVFRRTQTVISIVGVGGAGKSTLACALGRWVFDPDPLSRPVDHRMIPVLLAENTTNLLDSIAAYLRRMIDPEDIPVDLIRGLLAHKRLLVVVDALSERDAVTQAHVEQFHKLPDRVGALVVTSRTEPEFGPIERTVLHPVKLDARRIVPFIISYLDRRETEGRLRDGRTQLVLGEKILALA
nr:YCF48-related protein [Bradyrhizobium manausense]